MRMKMGILQIRRIIFNLIFVEKKEVNWFWEEFVSESPSQSIKIIPKQKAAANAIAAIFAWGLSSVAFLF
jgi:hypothetical protein